MPQLIFENGPARDRVFRFESEAVVGRGRQADAVVDDPSVSRRHAMLRWRENECLVVDLGSANGTLVNGRRIAGPMRLRAGDVVAFGTVRARYADDVPRPATEAEPTAAAAPTAGAPSLIVLAMPTAAAAGEATAGDTDAALAALRQRLAFLEELGALTGRTFDRDALVGLVLERVLTLVPQADRSLVITWDEATDALVVAGARTRGGATQPPLVSETLLRDAMRRREAFIVADTSVDERYAAAESIRIAGIRSAMCAPMLFDDRVYGALQVDATHSLTAFDRRDLSLLAGVAAYVGMALGLARLHARELEREIVERDQDLARRIQRRFLPDRAPEVPGYAVAVEYAPALYVGGDFFDFLDLGGGRVGVALGDVSGKGVPAALYAARLSSELRHHAAERREPAAIVAALNASLATIDPEGMFVTLVLAELDPAAGRLVVANAGHPLPLLRSAGGAVCELGRGGALPLGVSDAGGVDRVEHQLAPGDLVLFFTDGASEAMSGAGEVFGLERLREALARGGGTADAARRSVVAAVRAHAGGAPPSDDLTLVCIGRDRPDSHV